MKALRVGMRARTLLWNRMRTRLAVLAGHRAIFVNPQKRGGKDWNDGLTIATAIKTNAELVRRL